MSVNTHLADLASNLVLSDSEKSSISASITTLESRLDAYFGSNITERFSIWIKYTWHNLASQGGQ